MSKEELEKEAEEYALNTYEMCSYQDLPYASDRRAREQAFLAGAEPREKRIAELEDKLANADYQLEGRDNEIRELKEINTHTLSQLNLDNGELIAELTKAKDLLKKWVELFKPKGGNIPPTPIQVDTEQFLKGDSTAEQTNECHDCAKFDEMPKDPRCRTCDNGSRFQKKEEA